MHEQGVVSAAAAAFLEEVGTSPVAEVVLVIGPTMVAEVAEAAWEHVTAGTAAEQARVVWQPVQDLLQCWECGLRFQGCKLSPCPSCGFFGLVVQPAPDFAVRSWSSDVPR